MSVPSSATLHEAGGRIGVLPSVIKPVEASFRVAGPAYPVRCPAGDNRQLHLAVYDADPCDVLVVDVGDGIDFGYWGEVLSVAAKQRRLGGLVIHGCVRDRDQLAAVGFPVFSAGLCIRGTVKDRPGGAIGEPIRLDDVLVTRGDLVVGDCDGVVVIPAVDAERVIRAGFDRDDAEAEMMRRLEAGERTLELLNLNPLTGPLGENR